jgi:hypothetical protein
MSERQFSEHLQPSSDVIAAIAQTITFQFSTHININLIAIRLIYAINRHDASVTYRNDPKCFLLRIIARRSVKVSRNEKHLHLLNRIRMKRSSEQFLEVRIR